MVESNGHDNFDHLDDADSQSDVGSIDFVEAMEETPAVAGGDGVLQSMEAVDDRISRMFESVASSQEDDVMGIPIGVAELPPHSSNQSTISEFEMLDADEVDQQLDANAGSVRNSALMSPVASTGSSKKKAPFGAQGLKPTKAARFGLYPHASGI